MERWDGTEVRSGGRGCSFFSRQIDSTAAVVLRVRTQQRLRKCNDSRNTALNKKATIFNTDMIL